MRNKAWYDKHRWRLQHGYAEVELKSILIKELEDTEWSEDFEKLMRKRLIMGGLRYGKMGHGKYPFGKPKYDRCESIRKRLKFFEETGNAEWLVDIGNMALLMFEERQHSKWHFKAQDDGYHDEIIKNKNC